MPNENQRSEAWFRALMEQSPLSTQVFSPDGRTIQVNRAWERLWGATIEQVADYNILEDPQLVGKGIMPYIRRGFAGEALSIPAIWYDANETLPTPSTRKDPRRWVRAFIHPVKNEQGEITEVILIHEDMTDQKFAEDALRRSEQRFSRFMQNLPGLAWAKDVDGRYVYANDAAVKVFKTSRDELYDRTDDEVFPPETAAQFKQNDQLALTSRAGVHVVETLRHDDGIEHHSLVSKFPIAGANGDVTLIGGIAIDITELKQAQLALQASEQRLRLALDAGRMGVWEWNLESNTIWWSGNLETIHGLAPGSFSGTFEAFESLIHPEDRARVHAAIAKAIEHGGDYDIEFRNVWSDGSVHWLAGKGKVIPEPGGKSTRMIGVALDVTDRRRAEDALREADQRKDEFLATLAHELRNPLAPLQNSLQLLRMAGEDRAVQQQAYAVMGRQLRQMVRLVDDLLDVSRITRNRLELRKTDIELAAAIESAVEISRPVMESLKHELILDLPREPVYLHADLTRLAQVIANLLNNAAKYSNPGSTIRLTVTTRDDEVSLSVKDNGIGIDPHNLPKLFQIFSQLTSALDRAQGGLGIGLALVRGLVEMHGGTVEAHSEGLGKGSEFVVRLPTTQPPSERPIAPADKSQNVTNRHRVLVVDDNEDSATTLDMTLKFAGHETQTAYDGARALELADSWRPHVILLDIGLPNLNGYQVAERIRRQAWGRQMFLVALTGWGQDHDKQRAKAAGFDHHLTKPVDFTTLHQLLREARPAAS